MDRRFCHAPARRYARLGGACLRPTAPDNVVVTRSGVLPNTSDGALGVKSSATLPLLVWLLVQLAALGLAAGRVPLWARFPQPGELLALQFLVAAQALAASMCFPFLLRDLRTAACILASGWPMALIAGGLAAAPWARICAAEIHVSLFLIVLTIWRIPLRDSTAQSIAVAVTSLWTVGGAMLVYLCAEFAPTLSSLNDVLTGPLVAAVRVAQDAGFRYGEFLRGIGVLGLVGCVILLVTRVRPGRRESAKSA